MKLRASQPLAAKPGQADCSVLLRGDRAALGVLHALLSRLVIDEDLTEIGVDDVGALIRIEVLPAAASTPFAWRSP